MWYIVNLLGEVVFFGERFFTPEPLFFNQLVDGGKKTFVGRLRVGILHKKSGLVAVVLQ